MSSDSAALLPHAAGAGAGGEGADAPQAQAPAPAPAPVAPAALQQQQQQQHAGRRPLPTRRTARTSVSTTTTWTSRVDAGDVVDGLEPHAVEAVVLEPGRYELVVVRRGRRRLDAWFAWGEVEAEVVVREVAWGGVTLEGRRGVETFRQTVKVTHDASRVVLDVPASPPSSWGGAHTWAWTDAAKQKATAEVSPESPDSPTPPSSNQTGKGTPKHQPHALRITVKWHPPLIKRLLTSTCFPPWPRHLRARAPTDSGVFLTLMRVDVESVTAETPRVGFIPPAFLPAELRPPLSPHASLVHPITSPEETLHGDATTSATTDAKPPPPLTALTTSHRDFVEIATNRRVVLRGVNLSGSVKLPMGETTEYPSHQHWQFKEPEFSRNGISFVGRPFPLAEAPEHLDRIVRWGFNCLRFLVTWEAVSHAGPFEVDEEYLDYVSRVVSMATARGLYVILDAHQDVWSRATGGSGAPAWTLELAGLDLAQLEPSGAAFTHRGFVGDKGDPLSFPRMTWPQNYQRFAALHMFTLFFGGKTFAPKFFVRKSWVPGDANACEVPETHPDAIHIQDLLNNSFIHFWTRVAGLFRDDPMVVGIDPFNEPSSGMIGVRVDKHPHTQIPPGALLAPFEAWAAASGRAVQASRLGGLGCIVGSITVNPREVCAFHPDRTDPWVEAGVFGFQRVGAGTGTSGGSSPRNGAAGEPLNKSPVSKAYVPVCRNALYFTTNPLTREPVNFFRDFLQPFLVKVHDAVTEAVGGRRMILFAEGEAFGERSFIWDDAHAQGKGGSGPLVNATHWYDGATLFLRVFYSGFTVDVERKAPVFGRRRVYAMHRRDLRRIQELPTTTTTTPSQAGGGGEALELPTLLGEFGVPYDLNRRVGFLKNDWHPHDAALAMYYSLFDELGLSSTQWNYVSDNDNTFGDHWNLEDLSIFSRDQVVKPVVGLPPGYEGARGARGFSRPYAPVVAGERTWVVFYPEPRAEFELRYLPDASNFATPMGDRDHATCTVVYLPDIHFPFAPRVVVEGGMFTLERVPGRHVLRVWASLPPMATASIGADALHVVGEVVVRAFVR